MPRRNNPALPPPTPQPPTPPVAKPTRTRRELRGPQPENRDRRAAQDGSPGRRDVGSPPPPLGSRESTRATTCCTGRRCPPATTAAGTARPPSFPAATPRDDPPRGPATRRRDGDSRRLSVAEVRATPSSTSKSTEDSRTAFLLLESGFPAEVTAAGSSPGPPPPPPAATALHHRSPRHPEDEQKTPHYGGLGRARPEESEAKATLEAEARPQEQAGGADQPEQSERTPGREVAIV